MGDGREKACTEAKTGDGHVDTDSSSSNTTGSRNDDGGGSDTFELYDLRVEVVCPPGQRILCGAKDGDYFTLQGEMLYLPPNQGISIYSLSSVLPLLPAMQRVLSPNDWMMSDNLIACPDPNCPSRLRICRQGRRIIKRSDATVVPHVPRLNG